MHLTPVFGEKLLCDITPKAVEAYQQARLREGAQGRTVNIEIQALRQILKAHKCWKGLDGEIHSLKERKDVGRALTPEEEGRLLSECAKADSACYTAVVLALNTTMRKDEIRRLQLEASGPIRWRADSRQVEDGRGNGASDSVEPCCS